MVQSGVGGCTAQGSLWDKCTKWMCEALGQVWEEEALEDRNPGEMQ